MPTRGDTRATRRKKAKDKVLTVPAGNIGVKVYTRTRTTATGNRTVYEIADYATGRRRFHGFSDLSAAKKKAKAIATNLASGE